MLQGEVENPHFGLMLGAWAMLSLVSAALVRRALFAFLLGVLFTAGYVGYCAYYIGIPEMGGLPHALIGGAYTTVFYYYCQWLRKRRKSSTDAKEN
jgi:hypothetical protein